MNSSVLEDRLRERLQFELESEAIPVAAWEQIQRRAKRGSRTRWMALAASAAICATLAALVLPAIRGRLDRSTTVVVGGGLAEGGSVRLIDPEGDHRAPYLDITSAELSIHGNNLHVAWTVAGDFPDHSDSPIDVRVAIMYGEKAYVVMARLVGNTWQAGAVECRVGADETPQCPGATPQVQPDPAVFGRHLSVIVPLEKMGGLSERFEWKAYTERSESQ